jgi:MFS family permease
MLIVLTILSSTFLFALDNTIVADVQSPLVQQFGEVEKLSWIGVAFVLSGSAAITWYVLNEIRESVARPLTVELDYRGKLYAIFSAKWLYLSSVVLFETGSALCGAALTMNVFIVGRAIAGLGVGSICLSLLAFLL